VRFRFSVVGIEIIHPVTLKVYFYDRI
jgi:hypothetical protein